MTRRRAFTWIGWLAFAAAGVLCVTWVVAQARGPVVRLSDPDELIVYSLAGYEHIGALSGTAPEGELFHDVPVLGKLDVKNPRDRREIVAALQDGTARGDKRAFCFFPRHGIRVTQNGKTLDFVVCFECYQFKLYGDGDVQTLPITRDPQAVFNQHLQAAGVPLASGTAGAEK